jgi:flagellar biosynthetic protein FliO
MTFAPHIFTIQTAALGAQETTFNGGGESFFLMLLQTLLVLGLVCGLAYVIFRWVLPRLAVARSANSMVRVVDVVGLDARKRLYVIEVAGRWMLIASSEAGVQMLSELDTASAAEAAQTLERARQNWKSIGAAARATLAERLTRLTNKKG